MSKTYPIFEFYNVRTACIQINLTEQTNNNTNKKECNVFLTMAPTIDKNVSMAVVRKGGAKLFDYTRKIVMKLEKQEIAAFAKLRQPYFIKRYFIPMLDNQGQQTKDARGNVVLNTDVFVHADNKKGTTTTLTIGANQQDETGCYISTYMKEAQGYKHNIIYLNTNYTQELAIAAEWCLHKIYETISYERVSQTNRDNNNIQSSPSNENPQANKYTNSLPDIMDIDDMLK